MEKASGLEDEFLRIVGGALQVMCPKNGGQYIFSSFVFMLEIFMGHMWSIRGVFVVYTYVSGMYRVCIGYVSGMYRNKQEKWGKYLHI